MSESIASNGFGARIMYRMRKTQITRNELANTIGVTLATVARWISGETQQARSGVIPRLAETLGCEIRWLTTGEGPEEFDESMSPQRRALIREAYSISEQKVAALLFVIDSLQGREGDEMMVVKLALDEDERTIIQALRKSQVGDRKLLRAIVDRMSVLSRQDCVAGRADGQTC